MKLSFVFLFAFWAAECSGFSPSSQHKMERAFQSFGICVYRSAVENSDHHLEEAIGECAEESGVHLLHPTLLAEQTPETECLTAATGRLEEDAQFSLLMSVVDGWTVGNTDGRTFCTLFDGFLSPLLCELQKTCGGPKDAAFLNATAARFLAEQKFLRPAENITCSSNVTINPAAFAFDFESNGENGPLVLNFECNRSPPVFLSPSAESGEEEGGEKVVRIPLSRQPKN